MKTIIERLEDGFKKFREDTKLQADTVYLGKEEMEELRALSFPKTDFRPKKGMSFEFSTDIKEVDDRQFFFITHSSFHKLS